MRVALCSLCATVCVAFVAPVSSAPRSVAVAGSVTTDIPMVNLAGESTGTFPMSLRTTKGGNDMYVVHRKYVMELRHARAGTASTKTRAEVRGGLDFPRVLETGR